MDSRDWFVLILVAGIWIAGTVFIFLHPGDGHFAIWSGLCTTMGGIYHWLTIHDAKTKDAEK